MLRSRYRVECRRQSGPEPVRVQVRARAQVRVRVRARVHVRARVPVRVQARVQVWVRVRVCEVASETESYCLGPLFRHWQFLTRIA